MLVADTLSCTYLSEVNSCIFFRELEEVDHRANLPVSDERWQQLTHVSADDPVLKQLRTVIQCGWPERKSDVPMCLRPYFDQRDELVVQGNLIFKGPRLVVPACMRKELMSVAHATHIGIEGCLRRVREYLCLAHRTSQTKEPLLQHEVVARPRAKLAADLCELHGRTLLVVSDYFIATTSKWRVFALPQRTLLFAS